jgi:hypothetical protein
MERERDWQILSKVVQTAFHYPIFPLPVGFGLENSHLLQGNYWKIAHII